MKISLQWLQDFLTLPDSVSAEEIASRLTMAGTEVEEIVHIGKGLEGVIVAEVKAVEKHPNADRLSVCTVATGKENLTVVCGAANVRFGLKVALAPVGVTLPNELKIARSKIRGVYSEGMICSAAELGLSQDSSGIMELPANLLVGENLSKALDLQDTILDLSITPNRGDLLSHYGVARELAALLRLPLRKFEAKNPGSAGRSDFQVVIEDLESCPAYLGRLVTEITLVDSPRHIQKRLETVGLRPINQVVDATNYVMMEFGHPTHAFDRQQVKDAQIVVRRARAGEKLMLLDGKQREFQTVDLFIADPMRPLALAGIMGGEDSAIHPETTSVVLECAYFHSSCVRRTSRRIGVTSDSAFRFERGVDPTNLDFVMDRLAQHICEWTVAAGKPKPKIHETVKSLGNLPKSIELSMTSQYVNQILGTQLTDHEMEDLLKAIGIQKVGTIYQVPQYRTDLTRPIDLVEEIARIYGYERLPTTLPKPALRPVHEQKGLIAKRRVGELLRGYGFSEAIHYSFIAKADLDLLQLSQRQTVLLQNPLSEEQAIMRPLLLPGLLRTVSYNLNRGNVDLRLYECSKVFATCDHEHLSLGGVLVGKRFRETWSLPQIDVDFYDLKGVTEALFMLFNVLKIEYNHMITSDLERYPFLHPGKSVVLRSGRDDFGFMGAIHPQVLENLGIDREVFAFELPFDGLWQYPAKSTLYQPISQFPSVRRDLALVVPEEIPAKTVLDLIFSMKNRIIERVELFDIYRGKQVPEGKKSLAYAIHYLSQERTLTSEEVDQLHRSIVERLGKELGAQVRA